MNERIRELAEQAGVNPNKTMIDGNGYEFKFPDPNLQKFAELLVQDCRDMFVVGSVSWNLLNEKLEHFGVE